MKNLKNNQLSFLFIILTTILLLTACSSSKPAYNPASVSENTQLLSDRNPDTKTETSSVEAKTGEEKPDIKIIKELETNTKEPNKSENKVSHEKAPRNNLDPTSVKIPVLMYHSINPNSTNSNITTPEEFEKQIKWLKDNNFTPLFLNEVYSMITTGKNVPEKPIALTFDDGYEDNYVNAYPILKKYGFKATIFLITDAIGQPTVLNESQIKEMYANNIDFQSHTASHRELNRLTYQQQLAELTRSKEVINKMLNKNVDYLCYPVGRFNDETIKASKEAGYKMSFTTKPGHAKQSDGFYTLTRVRMSPGIAMEVFNKKK